MKEIETLVVQAQNGDVDAMGELYQQTSPRVFALALRLTKNREQAMDVVQETYLSAMQNIQKLQHPEALMSWLYQIAAHQCHRLYHKEGKYVLTNQEDDSGTPYFESLPDPDEAILPHVATEQADTRRLMLDLVERLPEQQRECVLLFYFSGCTVEQIAEIQDCSTGTVKSRLNYARKKLKEEIVTIEERDHVRFHTFLPLGLLFRCTAEELPAPSVFSELWQKVGTELGLSTAAAATGAAATAAGGQGAAGGTTAAATAKTTAATAIKVKLAAGITAGAVVIGGGAAAILHEPALDFADPAMEHNVRLLLDKPTGALHTDDLEKFYSLFLVDNGISLEWSEDGAAPEGSQSLSSLEDLALFSNLRNLHYQMSDGGALLQTLPDDMSVLSFNTNSIMGLDTAIVDLSFLDSFPELQQCSVDISPETDLTPLESKVTLHSLYFSFTGDHTLDISQLTNLYSLSFDNNLELNTITLYSDAVLPNLRTLNSYDTYDITKSPEMLSCLPSLESLDIHIDTQTDLSLLAQLPELRLLRLYPAPGTVMERIDLTPLLDCPSLELCNISYLPPNFIVPSELPLEVGEWSRADALQKEILNEIS
ncbi:sigma-70 family RNA polymerase sigma factor [Candidatus Avoscillospira sp. LCP25S3_F1]|uniref:sigma-70 family RNA polymerase sigma factor n=1 Tax=Candidatus Avoscillospira sp. LCP25S3_F1 TaxID=3438825 RepID=UPI003F8E8917